MSTTIVYKGLDISLEKNIYNDVPSVENFDSIKTTLYNNLLIQSSYIPFYEKDKLDINDVINMTNDVITQKFIQDCIQQAVNLDQRIKQIETLEITQLENDEYSWKIELEVSLNNNTLTQSLPITLLI
jgi:hypothetical protein